MAANWSDLTLFTSTEITDNLPAVFVGLKTGAKTFYHAETKRVFERMIKELYYGTGKLTSTGIDDFDIEQIDNENDLAQDILNASAIRYNYLLVARFNMTNVEDVTDTFGSYYTGNREDIENDIKKDLKQLSFLEPEGVNELTARSTPIVF